MAGGWEEVSTDLMVGIRYGLWAGALTASWRGIAAGPACNPTERFLLLVFGLSLLLWEAFVEPSRHQWPP